MKARGLVLLLDRGAGAPLSRTCFLRVTVSVKEVPDLGVDGVHVREVRTTRATAVDGLCSEAGGPW